MSLCRAGIKLSSFSACWPRLAEAGDIKVYLGPTGPRNAEVSMGTTGLQLTTKLALRDSLALELAQFTVEGGQLACLPR
jgi:hypothetical protein